MWICLRHAFISVVQDIQRPNVLMVRARKKEHLERLFPSNKVLKLPSRDYAFRVFIERQALKQVLDAQVSSLTYPNYKDAITDTGLHDLMLEFWHLHHRYQLSQSL